MILTVCKKSLSKIKLGHLLHTIQLSIILTVCKKVCQRYNPGYFLHTYIL